MLSNVIDQTLDNENGANDSALKDRPTDLQPKKVHPLEILLKQGAFSVALKVGETIEGWVMEKRGTRVFVDLGTQGTGIIYGREYYAAQEIIKGLKPGDKISAKIVELDNEDGYVELSLKDAGEERRWLDLQEAAQTGKLFELPAKEANRGGLILETSGIKGFLPASQLSAKNYPRVAGGDKEKIFEALQKLVGTTLKVKILDVSAQENKLIFTERESDEQAIRAALSKYKVGDEVEGEITGVVDFGAFLKFDEETGLEGLIHISEIDWTLIENPRDVLKAGDRVRAKIIDIQGDKISLSLKALKEDPWIKIAEIYPKGGVIRAKVTRFNPFGAFAELGAKDANLQGLIHISEFGTEKRMQEELELGREYNFKILLVDPKEHRMSLGMIRDEDPESKIQNQEKNEQTP